MLRRQLCASFLSALVLGGCSNISIPQRGFATRFYQSSVEPTLDPPAPFTTPPLAPDGKPVAPDSCEAIAHDRAYDIAAQDFSEEMQRKVFAATLQDCRTWRARLGGSG